MGRIEAAADAAGHSYARMMYLAASAVANAAREMAAGQPARAVILAGPGNNGGDGILAGHLLAEDGWDLRVLTWRRTPAADRMVQAAMAEHAAGRSAWTAPISMIEEESEETLEELATWLKDADLVVDALLGTGVSRPIDGFLARILEIVRGSAKSPKDRPYILAVDLPSGLNADSGQSDPWTLSADRTVTFGFPKLGQFRLPGAGSVGELVIDDIGIEASLAEHSDSELNIISDEDLFSALRRPALGSHKGSMGRAMIVAGSESYPGAAMLCAAACYRSGCGLVQMLARPGLQAIIAPRVPELVWYIDSATASSDIETDSLKTTDSQAEGSVQNLAREALRYGSLLVGPGLGASEKSASLVIDLIETLNDLVTPSDVLTLILDADALNHLAAAKFDFASIKLPCVLTPHPGEMARLCNCSIEDVQADRESLARKAAQDWNQIVLLKGAFSVLATPDGDVSLIPFANPALATAGTGDVLAGCIAGLAAQGLDPVAATSCGAWLHGRAGELAARDTGIRGAVASDLIYWLPRALREFEVG